MTNQLMLSIATASVMAHEGLRLKPYVCTAGKVTIGYGRNIEDNGITNEEAEHLLETDLARSIEELSAYDWFLAQTEERQAVLVDMVFNMGLPTLLKFKMMIAALEVQDHEEAAVQMLDSNWARQVGKRSQTLAETMRTGVQNYV